MEEAALKEALDRWEADGGVILEPRDEPPHLADAPVDPRVPTASEGAAKSNEPLHGS
jgi:hypothetical protein